MDRGNKGKMVRKKGGKKKVKKDTAFYTYRETSGRKLNEMLQVAVPEE